MNPYRDPSQQTHTVAMSPRPGVLGGPGQQMSGQSQQQQQQLQQGGPQGMMPVGMGRGASNTGLQGSVLALANHVGGGQPSQNPQHLMQGDVSDNHNALLLNSYIYDHLVKHGFYKAAKGLLQETSVLTTPRGQDDSSPNQDNDGNLLARRATGLKRSHSGMDDHPNSSPNDKPNGKSPRSTSNSPHIGNNDLPAPNVPLDSSGGFLSEWWAVFWDVFAARSNHNDATPYAQAYLDNQRNQQRMPQFQGQFNQMQQRAQMMNGVADDLAMDKKTLMHTAIVNNGRKINRPGQHPMPMQQNQQQNQAQLMAMRQQQQQQAEQQQQRQQQQQQLLQRENDEQNSSSPAMGQGNSPNKRPRLSPPNDFQIPNSIQPPNGLTPAQQAMQQQQQNHNAAQQYLKANGVQMTPGASPAEVVNAARQVSMQLQQAGNQPNKGSVHAYKQNLAQQQSQQVMAGRTALGGSASPAGQQATIPGFPTNPGIPPHLYNNRSPTQAELEKLTKTAQDLGGQLTHPQSGGSHSLQDYQSQLMVLEQQNQKRLQHARQETTTRSDDPGNNGGGPMNGQFGSQGQLQPGHQMQGTNMSPQNSRAGPSPQISNLELSQQRKPGQKTTSGGASPEPGDSQIRGPSPAFTGPGAMTQEHYQQMTMNHYPQGMLNQNGAGAFIPGRQHSGMPFGQGQAHLPQEMMKMSRMAQGQPGQYPPGWQQMANQQHLNQMRMLPSQQGPPGQPTNAAQQQMPPPPQPQQPQNGRPQAPGESPSLANAPTPTPTPGNKPPPKGKAAKEGTRAKRNRKNTAAPATPNATEPPAPTTPITPHAAPPAFQPPPSQPQQSQPQQQPQQPVEQQQPPAQDPAPPSAFATIDHASDPATDGWPSDAGDKWMTGLPIDFSTGFPGDFGNATFPNMDMGNEIIDYGEFLNDSEGLTMDFPVWGESDLGTEA